MLLSVTPLHFWVPYVNLRFLRVWGGICCWVFVFCFFCFFFPAYYVFFLFLFKIKNSILLVFMVVCDYNVWKEIQSTQLTTGRYVLIQMYENCLNPFLKPLSSQLCKSKDSTKARNLWKSFTVDYPLHKHTYIEMQRKSDLTRLCPL